jgi:cob(I)alamin adenosyltransferase
MIHLYYGDGKGKTTAAVGQAVRAKGSGIKTIAVQFLKGSPSGEVDMLRKMGIEVLRCDTGTKFVWDMSDEEKQALTGRHNENIRRAMNSGCDMIVMDELCDAFDMGLADEKLVEELFCGDFGEIVITGHNPSGIFFAHADYITEMKKIAHPFDKGISARKGIEY